MAIRGWRWRVAGVFSLWGVVAAAPAYGQSDAGSSTPSDRTHVPASALVRPALATRDVPLVLRGVTVVDVRTGRRLPNRTVVITGRRIQALGRTGAVRVPRGAQVVDARGRYLIPGLWDMHAHPRGFEATAFPLFVANGVTGVRDAASDTPLATLADWKRRIEAGTVVGPRLLVVGPAISEGDTAPPADAAPLKVTDQGHGFIAVPRALLPHVIDSLKAAGADMLKMYFLSRQGFFTFAAAARRAGIMFGGHRPNAVNGIEASDSGATFLDHLEHPCWGDRDSLRGVACAQARQRFRQQGSWVVFSPASLCLSLAGQSPEATAVWFRRRARQYWHSSFTGRAPGDTSAQAMAADARLAVREPAATTDWVNQEICQSVLPRLRADGVPLLVGSDLGVSMMTDYLLPGFSTPLQLVPLVLGGFTPLEALQAATLNPARALHATDSLGTVEAGKVADLVLLDADPLVDIWHTTRIRAVVANGRYFDRAALDQLLAEVQATVTQQP